MLPLPYQGKLEGSRFVRLLGIRLTFARQTCQAGRAWFQSVPMRSDVGHVHEGQIVILRNRFSSVERLLSRQVLLGGGLVTLLFPRCSLRSADGDVGRCVHHVRLNRVDLDERFSTEAWRSSLSRCRIQRATETRESTGIGVRVSTDFVQRN